MKKLIFIIALTSLVSHSQVGINTVTPDELVMLDVQGFAQISVSNQPNSEYVLVVNDTVDGTIGWKEIAEGSGGILKGFINIEHWANSGIYNIIANGTYYNLDNIDLEFDVTISVPPRTIHEVKINYDIPVSNITPSSGVLAKVGVRFYKDGVEQTKSNGIEDLAISTKGNADFFPYVEVDGIFHDWAINTSYTDNLVIVYSLKGFVEQYQTDLNGSMYVFRYWDGVVKRSGFVNARILVFKM